MEPSGQVFEPRRLAGQVAVVTGATSGIGQAIALALAHKGARLCVVGRDPVKLAATVEAIRQVSFGVDFQIDLTLERDLQPLVRYLEKESGRLDILIHSAGVICRDRMASARMEDLDIQYATNVRAPYMVTQQLLPLLRAARGQVVFINSSAGLTAKQPDVGQYAATKHALKAVADSLREEVNPEGIRVLSVYLGRTATPMQESLHQREGKAYHPEALMQPEDVASLVVQALLTPATAEVTDISVRPMRKSTVALP
jgi:NAD(P)-dependent dehydrogenase (short-subunit alcohol dehydrogenase family)